MNTVMKLVLALLALGIITIVIATLIKDNDTYKFSKITNVNELNTFVVDTMNITCPDDSNHTYETSDTYLLPVDEFGNYGYRGTTIINNQSHVVYYTAFAECQVITEWNNNGQPSGGTFLFRIDVDPNNGWIRKQTCNYELTDSCPKNEDGSYVRIDRPITENPAYESYLALNI
jgi:hypothetical protein